MTNGHLAFISGFHEHFLIYVYIGLLTLPFLYTTHILNRTKSKLTKFYCRVALIPFLIIPVIGYRDARTIVMVENIIKNKTYRVIEGEIEDLQAMHKSGHGVESFNVNGVHFEFGYTGKKPNDATLFYRYTKNLGGPIKKNGQKVKIHYISEPLPDLCIPFIQKCAVLDINTKNEIVKLWVEDNK